MSDPLPPGAPTAAAAFHFDNSYAKLNGFFAPWQATEVPQPEWLLFNRPLAAELGLDADLLDTPEGAAIFSGNLVPDGAEPLAQAYAGHQFGGFAGQLGDGRALLLGEVVGKDGVRRDIQLKGSGPTPFSRGGDGRAPLGPVLREYVVAEAMHNLGIPTTRALAAVSTGEPVFREESLPGAVLTRVAASHIRIGTFQFFASRNDQERVQRLADYAIDRHYPELAGDENRYLSLFKAVIDRQAQLVAQWMNVGFIHGVMNTDNMTISGETIDYGPCAYLDSYDPKTFFSSIDTHGRYAFGNQPVIAQWNLARFAETLLQLFDEQEPAAIELAQEALGTYNDLYVDYWLDGMRKKLGLTTQQDSDRLLATEFLRLAADRKADFTQLFRSLSQAVSGTPAALLAHLGNPEEESSAEVEAWLQQWQERLAGESIAPEERAQAMNLVNPVYIPRNHKVEEAIHQAVRGEDLSAIHQLIEVLSNPFEEQEGRDAYAEPADPDSGPYKTFCGT